LDCIEGVGYGYDRRLLELDDHGAVHTYVASAGATSPTLRPYHWYRDIVAAGVRYHAFPDSYLEEIKKVEAKEDRNRKRAEKNRGTLEKLRSAGSLPASARCD